jgi:uncharacterized protein
MLITPFYAALLALIFLILSIRTLRMRRALAIAVGDAGNAQMLRAMRVHANFAEYVPLALILFYFTELHGAPMMLNHLLGAGLLIGRLSHAFGVAAVKENYRYRIFGMASTFTPMLIAAAYILWSYLGTAYERL